MLQVGKATHPPLPCAEAHSHASQTGLHGGLSSVGAKPALPPPLPLIVTSIRHHTLDPKWPRFFNVMELLLQLSCTRAEQIFRESQVCDRDL